MLIPVSSVIGYVAEALPYFLNQAGKALYSTYNGFEWSFFSPLRSLRDFRKRSSFSWMDRIISYVCVIRSYLFEFLLCALY